MDFSATSVPCLVACRNRLLAWHGKKHPLSLYRIEDSLLQKGCVADSSPARLVHRLLLTHLPIPLSHSITLVVWLIQNLHFNGSSQSLRSITRVSRMLRYTIRYRRNLAGFPPTL